MASFLQPQLLLAGLAGLSGGAVLFTRGLAAYRRGAVVRSIATSSIDSLAVGEVRLTGTVEPLAATLISPLQSAPCVWYCSSIVESGRNSRATVFDEERSVEFRIRDASGTVRVVPRGGRWELAPVLDESSGLFGGDPVSVRRRVGPSSMAVPEFDREAAIADLLTVRPATPDGNEVPGGSPFPSLLVRGGGIRHYREARLEPGQTVTLVGFAQPYGQLGDEDALTGATLDDISIGADLAEARDAGLLARSPEEAWGNAAIPGFGIGHPVRSPHLDAGADAMTPADARQASRAEQVFAIARDTLVISGGRQTPLVIYASPPPEARAHDRAAFYRGLAGAGLATVSAAGLAIMINGGL
jgi:hypothetical protein